jgi:hypothetical protein
MADYPSTSTLPINDKSTFEVLNGTRLDRTTNGDVKAQNQYASDKHIFNVIHKGLSTSAKSSLDTIYTNKRTSIFTFDWIDGSTYTVFFAHAPKYTYWRSKTKFDAIVTLVEQ